MSWDSIPLNHVTGSSQVPGCHGKIIYCANFQRVCFFETPCQFRQGHTLFDSITWRKVDMACEVEACYTRWTLRAKQIDTLMSVYGMNIPKKQGKIGESGTNATPVAIR